MDDSNLYGPDTLPSPGRVIRLTSAATLKSIALNSVWIAVNLSPVA